MTSFATEAGPCHQWPYLRSVPAATKQAIVIMMSLVTELATPSITDTLPRLIYKDSTPTLLYDRFLVAFRALTLLVGGRKGIRPVKNGGWWRWALLSPDGVAPSRMVGVSASVNLPLYHKVQEFSSGTG